MQADAKMNVKALLIHTQCTTVEPGNVASPGNVIIYGKCRTVAGKCRNLLKTS